MKNPTVTAAWRLVFVALSLLVLARLRQELKRAPFYGTEATYDAEERVNVWLLSAACFQSTKVPLVLCGRDGRLYPIEDVSLADDRGHAMLATAAALLRPAPVTRITLVKINLCINALGILVLAFMWKLVQMPWTSLITLGLGCLYGLPGPLPGHDAPACYFGVFCLTAAAVLWAASSSVIRFSRVMLWIGSAISATSLAFACMLRQPIGLVGAITVVILLIFPFFRRASGRVPAFKRLLVGGVLIVLSLYSTPAVLKSRNVWYRIPEATSYHSHGIWHTLYLGLGWDANPWGIQWDDRYGSAVVSRMDPRARYGTYAYFRIMKELYWRLLWREPGAVLKIYGRKLLQTWNFPLAILKIRISRWFLLMVGLAIALSPKATALARGPLMMILSLGILYLVFSAQGVLAIPTGTHLYPLKFCVLMMMAAWADFLACIIFTTEMPVGPTGGDDRTPAPGGAEAENDPANADH